MSFEVIKFKNPTDTVIKLAPLGLPDVEPNGTVEVPIALAAPTRRDNGSRGSSSIEKCAPQLVPVDPEIRKEWDKAPAPPPPKSLMVTSERRDPDEPAGVKALREAAQSLAKKAEKPVTAPRAGG